MDFRGVLNSSDRQEKEAEAIKDVISAKLYYNATRVIDYPRQINGISLISYFIGSKRILLLGEVHGSYPDPNILDLLKFYINQTPIFLDIFTEQLVYRKTVLDRYSTIGLVREYFKNRSITNPYRYHRFDIRVASAYTPPEDNELIVRDIRDYYHANKLSHVTTFEELVRNYRDAWTTDPLIAKEKSRIVDPSILPFIYDVLDDLLNSDFIQNEKIYFNYYWKILFSKNKFADDEVGGLISAWVFLTQLDTILTDWYLLLRLFKRFDSNIQPKTADNCIIYGGAFHIETYRKFLRKIGYSEVYSNVNGILPGVPPLFEI